jgi:DNA helicase II / ATP-dependent DNA helicase PcrA
VSKLSDEHQNVIAEESALLIRIQDELARLLAQPVSRTDFDRQLVQLRDQLADTHAEDHAMLVEHMTRLAALRVAKDRDYEPPVDPANPYFGRLRLKDRAKGEERTRDVLIGKRAFIDSRRDVQVVDWRNSPISRIFYCYEEGDEYEETFAGEKQTGHVSLRRTINVAGGHLVRIRCGNTILLRDDADEWYEMGDDRSTLSGGVGTAIRAPAGRLGRGGPDQRLPEITALIDPEQFRAITQPQSGIVVIRGGAGTGKTTIALHRIAYLFFQDRRRYSAKRVLVITPGEGLKKYVSKVLPALDVHGVRIWTFGEWAMSSVKRLVPTLRKRKLTDETPSGARRLKRHPALLAILKDAVDDECRSFDEAFEQCGAKVLDAWVRRRNLPPIQRLDAFKRWVGDIRKGSANPDAFRIRQLVQRATTELGDPFETWANVLTDRQRLRSGFSARGVQFYDWEIEQLVDTVAQQSDDPSDSASLGEHGVGIDGVSIFAGEIKGRLDTDDWATILRICQLKYGRLSGPSGQVIGYEHVVVDEAQDLSPLAIKLLCETARPGSPVTLSGDTAQRLYLDSGFANWEQLIKDIRIRANILPTLAVSYRSTRQVMDLARHVLGDLADEITARDARDGAPVELMSFEETGEAVAFLGDALKSLRSRERRCSVALVARTNGVADLYYNALRRAEVPDMRRIHRQEFDFSPGIDVTDVYQIKGLEYDYIVLLEPTLAHYPDTIESRHLLHVAATRAAHQLWLITSDKPSPLLPEWLTTP